jgi:hypothetical protein
LGRVKIPLAPGAALAAGLLAGSASPVPAQANALVSQAREVQRAVEEIRDLAFLHAVPMQVADREAIRAYAVSRLDHEYTPEEFRGKSESLIAWGLVERPFDMRGFYEELLAEQIGGYYDPFQGVFFIADWLPALLQKPIMAHELTHALQDQHFHLRPVLEGTRSNDDASLAGAAVVEGEGLAVMIDYALRPVGLSFESVPNLESLIDARLPADSAGFRVFSSAPPIVKQTLLFPYLQGLLFVRAAKTRGGWGRVSALYDSLPGSAEQVLWPEKYFEARDRPTPVALPDVSHILGSGWKRIDSNVLGELGNRVELERASSPAEALEGARGWDGDRYNLYERHPGETVLVSVSVWDTESDAAEFEAAWRRVLEADATTRDSHVVRRRGTVVTGLVRVPPRKTEAVFRALQSHAPSAPVP